MVEFKAVEAMVEQKKYKEALVLFNDFDYLKMTLAEMRKVDSILQTIPKEIRCKNSKHIVENAYICKMLGDTDGFEGCYKALVLLRDEARDDSGEKDKLERCISRVNMMRAKTNNAQTIILLSALITEEDNKYNILPCSATSKRPSVLRGTKDCSEWGKYDKAVKSILSPVLGKLDEFDGKCAIELAIGELYLEKGDFNGALMSLGIAVTSDLPDIRYGAYYALARLYLLDGETDKAVETIENAVRLIEDSGAYWLSDNMSAVLADIAIYKGDKEYIESWMTQVKDVVKEKILPDTEYISLIYVKALMSKGEWREATLLLQRLTDHFDNNLRTLDAIECRILCALSLMKLDGDDKAIELLHLAVNQAKPYGYTTVFADKGKLMFRLLGKYQKMYSDENGYNKFVSAISAQAKKISLILPSEFNDSENSEGTNAEPPTLTDTEVRILQLLSDGASNKAVGAELDIKLTTVKFHVKNLFAKFDVQSRIELLNKARSLKYLS